MNALKTSLIALTLTLPFAPVLAAAKDFRLETYFAGTTHANGSFRAINGVSRTFKVKLTGKWNGKTLRLQEDFLYNDGERDRKVWYFTKTGPTTYTGKRDDVVGGTDIRIVGDTARYSYDVYLNSAEKKNKVRFHDAMTLKADGTVLNNALVTKFGFPVARTRVVFGRNAHSK